jgi:drug/metabolite transporter (DMT)-like permease
MNWFLIALINPVAHAIANHLDKYLISKFFKNGSVGALVLFSSLFAVIILPLLWILEPDILHTIPASKAILLMLNGSVLMLAIIFYLYALEIDEASYVTPLFQLIPVFGLFFGFVVLKETLALHQLVAAAVVLFGGLLLSLELTGERARIKSKVVWLMVGSSLFYAINTVVFKYVAVDQGFISSLFWDMLGKVGLGIILFAVVRSYRREFINSIKANRAGILGLNALSEIISLIGETALVFAVLYAPVALVQSVGSIQPVFVFILGVIITLFFPKLGKESLTKHQLTQKICAIIIISLGAYLLES